MSKKKLIVDPARLPLFNRDFFGSKEIVSRIGTGAIGGKASGLVFIKDSLVSEFEGGPFGNIKIGIPRFAVITTDFFDRFMARNHLYDIALSDQPDQYIAHAFQKADMPPEMVGDLRGLIIAVRQPLAVRSSSLMEDAMYEPFAGVYATKMIPNNQPEIDIRFQRLVEAIKFVWASVFFKAARDYHKAAGKKTEDEKMAVIIQEVVGRKHYDRFYPDLAGVARSYNFYPMGRARPEEGVVDLALGLGKTIVDGGLDWTYSPAHPRVAPPTGSPRDLLKLTQTEFWAVNMGKPPEYNPLHETEYLIKAGLSEAEYDGVLTNLASTYRPQDDKIVICTGSPGPRAITFAPLLSLELYGLNELLKKLLKLGETALGSEIEIEFAMSIEKGHETPANFGFLQIRPMVVSHDKIEIDDRELSSPHAIAASNRVLGNGTIDTLNDVVYVIPETFNAKDTPQIARELAEINHRLLQEGRRYMLIGFGRWGSSDPWLGIPVEWGQISGSRVMVEATLPGMDVELSQGSHFFHNITCFRVFYFSVHHAGPYHIAWERLAAQKEIGRTPLVRHIRFEKPLTAKVDGRAGKGVILYDDEL